MAKTIEELKTQSAEVKNATVVGENTATRVGTLFNDIVEYIEQVPADGTLTTKKLAPSAITTEKIANGAVTTEKLADRVKQAITYDVSAHNNGAVFETLQALLSSSNLDTLIPVSFRHGGMIIRFIQGFEHSSDNKYVQARCMAQNFTTDITQWQGVDEKPITASHNLVEGGGIAKEIIESTTTKIIGEDYEVNGDSGVRNHIQTLKANKQYLLCLEYSDTLQSDLIPGASIIFYPQDSYSNGQEIWLRNFNSGNGVKASGYNTYLFTPNADVNYVRFANMFVGGSSTIKTINFGVRVDNSDVYETKEDASTKQAAQTLINKAANGSMLWRQGQYRNTFKYENDGNNIFVTAFRLYGRGTVDFSIISLNGLKLALNVEYTKAPSGADSIKIDKEKVLVYDTSDNSFKIVSENSVSTNHIILAAVRYGTVIAGFFLPYVLAPIDHESIRNQAIITDKIRDLAVTNSKIADGTIQKEKLSFDISLPAETPINVFGEVLPTVFKNKLLAMEDDLLVTVCGDSIVGLVEDCAAQTEPEHCPPGQQYRDWITRVQEYVNKNKPVYDRLDSQRNSADVFTKVGTWTLGLVGNEATIDANVLQAEASESCLTNYSSDTNASVSFVFDASKYDKCNIIFSKEPDAVLTKIIIAEGNGKMIVSEDRTNWVEANEFTYNQRTNLEGYTQEQVNGRGISLRERHRRLWMKKVDGVTDNINITYSRDNSIEYSNSKMYFWGTEKYSNAVVLFDNIGRGGRQMFYQIAFTRNITDRHPDLILFEIPMINETRYNTKQQHSAYDDYFLKATNTQRSLRFLTNDYTIPMIIISPHGRAGYFDNEDRCIRWEPGNDTDQPAGMPPAYMMFMQTYSWLKGQMSAFTNVSFVNMYDQLINEAKTNYSRIKDGFIAYTSDGTHLNDLGAVKYCKYLAALFNKE